MYYKILLHYCQTILKKPDDYKAIRTKATYHGLKIINGNHSIIITWENVPTNIKSLFFEFCNYRQEINFNKH